jgi:hypothetical protein
VCSSQSEDWVAAWIQSQIARADSRKRDDNSVYKHALGAVVARQGVELRLVEIEGWGAGCVECHGDVAGEAQQRKRRGRELGSSVRITARRRDRTRIDLRCRFRKRD